GHGLARAGVLIGEGGGPTHVGHHVGRDHARQRAGQDGRRSGAVIHLVARRDAAGERERGDVRGGRGRGGGQQVVAGIGARQGQARGGHGLTGAYILGVKGRATDGEAHVIP